MLTVVQQFIDRTTIYKMVSYALCFLIAQAFVMSAFDIVSYTFISLLLSLFIISATSLLTHFIFQKIYKAPANIESTYISIFITFLILTPVTNKEDAVWALLGSFVIIASKYLVAYKYRHIFNPVAVGLFVIGVMGSTSVVWWVSSQYFLPSLIVVAFFVITKLQRQTLFFSYLALNLLTVTALTFYHGENSIAIIAEHLFSWPLVFLGVFMLTEPLTTPPTKKLQMVYGMIVGVVSSVPYAFPPVYGTPELALLVGNLFSFTMNTKGRVFLAFIEKKEIAKDTFEFIFSPSEKIHYQSGQYMEWTFPHAKVDMRGIRRYFTIASSPKEDVIRLGVKRSEKGSSFKEVLFDLEKGKGLLATSVMGDFVVPEDKDKPLVFIAGGIGITPFVSMLRTLLLAKEKRDIVLFYTNKQENEIAYKDVLNEAVREFGLSVVYVLSDMTTIPNGWSGEKGFISEEMIQRHVTAIVSSSYYISGPPSMVSSYSSLLQKMHICKRDIATDFFPGFN